ncbi:N-acetylglucosamine-6-phosphate deacetylase [Benzoatithermus flavus]|uniref:Amidohydrolase family protein n=1 Tax=Benzoatithermus flavus TaxID=3108223 RepID=A0ABU8XVU4_9PROT
METTVLSGQILTPAGWIAGTLRASAQILGIEPGAAPVDRFVVPGFVDLHVHGGAGADCMEGADSVRRMARFHARHGTTALLATTVTAAARDLRAAMAGIAAAMAAPAASAARVLGVHLEGPFINPAVLGAQPPFAIPPDPALLEELAAAAPIRVATYAPEIDPDGALLACFRRLGIKAQIGHTACSYAEASTALAAGAAGFTHLFNAMSGLHHRKPGAVGAALAHAEAAELILDFQHVEPGAALVALRAVPGLYCITDAVAAAGMPDGTYRLGRRAITKRGSCVRLEDGNLAGSVLTMDRALRNLLALGLPLAEAARRCSTLAADHLGLADRGRLVPGAAADLVVLDAHGRLEAVLAEGRPVEPATA